MSSLRIGQHGRGIVAPAPGAETAKPEPPDGDSGFATALGAAGVASQPVGSHGGKSATGSDGSSDPRKTVSDQAKPDGASLPLIEQAALMAPVRPLELPGATVPEGRKPTDGAGPLAVAQLSLAAQGSAVAQASAAAGGVTVLPLSSLPAINEQGTPIALVQSAAASPVAGGRGDGDTTVSATAGNAIASDFSGAVSSAAAAPVAVPADIMVRADPPIVGSQVIALPSMVPPLSTTIPVEAPSVRAAPGAAAVATPQTTTVPASVLSVAAGLAAPLADASAPEPVMTSTSPAPSRAPSPVADTVGPAAINAGIPVAIGTVGVLPATDRVSAGTAGLDAVAPGRTSSAGLQQALPPPVSLAPSTGDRISAVASPGRDRAPIIVAPDAANITSSAPLAAPSDAATPMISSATAPAVVADPAVGGTVSDQVAGQLLHLVSSGSRDMVMRLRPPELGDLTVRVAVSGRDVTAWFASPQLQVQTVISDALGQLQTSLGDAGYNLNGAWVGADASNARQHGAGVPTPLPPGPLAAAPLADLSATPVARPLASGLNIYV